jgi:cyclophilin family peptidyl-prolyl cis-trans isomerase
MSLNAVMVHGTGTTFSQFFVNDDDTPVLDDQAILMGVKWMFMEIKGFGSYVTLQGRWVDYVEKLIARDSPSATLSLVKRVNPIFISPANVQDGFFPGPSTPNMS